MNKYSALATKLNSSGKTRAYPPDAFSLSSPKNLQLSFSLTELPPVTPQRKSNYAAVSEYGKMVNERVLEQAGALFQGNSRGPDSVSKNSRMLSERDFNTLITQLDCVIANSTSTGEKIALNKAKSVTLTVGEGKTAFIQIPCRSKKTPLEVKIVRKCGAIQTYMSKSLAEPSPLSHDESYTGDRFRINEPSFYFQASCIYLAVVALETTQFTLSVQFGMKAPRPALATSVSARELLTTLQKARPKPAPTPSSKNFLKQNKRLQSLRPTPQSTKVWEVRQQEATRRKTEIIREKRERTLTYIHKHKEKQSQERHDRIFSQQLTTLKAQQALWLTLIHFANAINATQTLLKESKSDRLNRLRRSLSIKVIQRAWKGKFDQQVTLTRASNCLLLFQQCVKLAPPLVPCIRASAKNSQPTQRFSHFITHVAYIQRQWRHNLQRSKDRFVELQTLWMTASQAVAEVSDAVRDEVLQKFYAKKKKAFKKKVRDYFDSVSYMKRLVLATISDQSAIISDAFPTFEYLPTEAELLKLVKVGIKRTKQQTKINH